MAKSQGNKKSIMKPINQEMDIEQKEDMSVVNYDDDDDYDEAFKILLRPVELITRTNFDDHTHFGLVKELDSYINHLKISPGGESSTFVEAALMIQNVNFIYQRKVDEIVDDTMKLIAKFQAYRANKNGIEDVAEIVEDKKKTREIKKLFSAFEPIEIESAPMKKFDCKQIDVSKLPPLPNFVLNTNIKITNKYNGLLPHIYVGNGGNIGKKYDFKMSGPVNARLAVNESTHCISNLVKRRSNYLNYLETNDPVDFDYEDDYIADEKHPEPAVFEDTISGKFGQTEATEEVCAANAMAQSPAKLVNADKEVYSPQSTGWWTSVETKEDNVYKDKPFVKKNISKKKPKKSNKNNDKQSNDKVFYIASYIPLEKEGLTSFMKMKPCTPDPTFKVYIQAAQKKRRSELMKMRYKQMMESLDKSEPEQSGSSEFKIPVYMGDFDNGEDDMGGIEDVEEPEIDPIDRENTLTDRKNLQDMNKYEQEMATEHLEMRKRVQAWHDKLRPILDEEEKAPEFDVHEYGTRMLNRFSKVGEQKTFSQLFGGMEKEEVSRYFLSILMLTNTGNFEILKPPTVGETTIELLKKERHHEELQVNVGNQVNKE